jgi:hypothetical protein
MAPTSTASSAAPAVTFSVLGLTVAVVLTALGLTAMAILFFLRHRHSKSPEGPIILELPHKD